jgi:hypothetical protein
VLLLSAMDRCHIVSQFKQRERVVIIDPARDPEAVNLKTAIDWPQKSTKGT